MARLTLLRHSSELTGFLRAAAPTTISCPIREVYLLSYCSRHPASEMKHHQYTLPIGLPATAADVVVLGSAAGLPSTGELIVRRRHMVPKGSWIRFQAYFWPVGEQPLGIQMAQRGRFTPTPQ